MEPRSAKFVAEACGGRLVSAHARPIARVCTDSREAGPGDLFVALAGERFDGHNFLGDVVARGATAVMVEEKKVPGQLGGCAAIAVANTRQAFGKLGARYRADFDLPVVAVGGSNGKTTTKFLIASVLSQKLRTLASEASFNNDIGVPATLLKMEKSHQAAVLEVGTNHPGELAPLLQMIQPRFGVITNIGREHLEFFGSLEGVAAEEGRIAEVLPHDGILFVHGDDAWSEKIALRSKGTTVRVGLSTKNDWRASDLRFDGDGLRFNVSGSRPALTGDYRINLVGQHQVVNALFAIAVADTLALSRSEIQAGLSACPAPKMRLQIRRCGAITILDDAYNANADSMVAALQTLVAMPWAGRRVAVLGDMAELGEHANEAHQEVGRRAAELGVDQLFVVGPRAAIMGQSAGDAGLKNIKHFDEVGRAAIGVKEFVRGGDLILVKASRSMRLERIVDALQTSH